MKLKINERWTLSFVSTLAYASGALLFVLSRYIRVTNAIGEGRHPMEHWARVSHTAFTYLLVMGVGYLFKAHVLPGLRSPKKNRLGTGLSVLALFFFLVGSAVVTLYAGESSFVANVVTLHAVIGLMSPAIFLIHVAARARVLAPRTA